MKAITRREALQLMVLTGTAATSLAGCVRQGAPNKTEGSTPASRRLRILATSDLHGMFVPWDYPLDEEYKSGSVAQLATAIRELRDEDTLLVDAGDTIQDNMAELFLADEVHPMIACMNKLGYDIGVTGNHEYNYGMDVVRKTVASFAGKVLTGNVIDEEGNPIADGYTIIDKNGVRVGLIGMVTPNITHWDKAHLEGCVVSNPVEETRAIIDQIKDEVDVLIGVMHMGLENELDLENTGARDMAQTCPEFDLIVASHDHLLIEGEIINGVLVVENKNHGQSMAVVDLTLEPDGEGWKVVDRSSNPVDGGTYEPDPTIMELMAPYDERAKAYAHEVIGTLEGEPLAPANEIAAIPSSVIMDTALVDLVNEVQLYHTGADVSAAAVMSARANIEPGPILRCDTSLIYKYNNTLCTLEMTGAQLKAYLEWSANFFKQYHDGDLTLTFNADIPLYNYDMLTGVNYQINVAKHPGERIENLSWPNGTPVTDSDVFILATTSYRTDSQLLAPGIIFEEGNLPKLLQADVHSSMGGIRAMVGDYIENVKGGKVAPVTDGNWQLVGNDWDPELHAQAVKLIAEGKIALECDDWQGLPVTAVTQEDVENARS